MANKLQVDSITRLIPDGFYTRGQAAKQIGKSKDTLIRWQEDNVFVPKWYADFGKVRVWLYKDEDLVSLRQIAKTMKPGRPRKTA